MTEYDFDPVRCKRAIEALADLVYDIPVTDQEKRQRMQQALDGLIIDIEALHRAAQERDQLADSIIELSAIDRGYECFYIESEVDELVEFLFDGHKRELIADLNL